MNVVGTLMMWIVMLSYNTQEPHQCEHNSVQEAKF